MRARRKAPILTQGVLILAGLVLLLTNPGTAAPPEERVLDSISRLFEPVTFPHAMHVDAAESCSSCHHQHGHIAGVPGCASCHKLPSALFKESLNLASMSPCRTCHPAEVNPEAPGLPTLQVAYHMQCLGCHAEADNLRGRPGNCTAVCHERRKVAAR